MSDETQAAVATLVRAIARHTGDNVTIDPATSRPWKYAIALSDAELLNALQERAQFQTPMTAPKNARDMNDVEFNAAMKAAAWRAN